MKAPVDPSKFTWPRLGFPTTVSVVRHVVALASAGTEALICSPALPEALLLVAINAPGPTKAPKESGWLPTGTVAYSPCER